VTAIGDDLFGLNHDEYSRTDPSSTILGVFTDEHEAAKCSVAAAYGAFLKGASIRFIGNIRNEAKGTSAVSLKVVLSSRPNEIDGNLRRLRIFGQRDKLKADRSKRGVRSGRKRKQHSAEFKARVAMAALSGEKTWRSCRRSLGFIRR